MPQTVPPTFKPSPPAKVGSTVEPSAATTPTHPTTTPKKGFWKSLGDFAKSFLNLALHGGLDVLTQQAAEASEAPTGPITLAALAAQALGEVIDDVLNHKDSALPVQLSALSEQLVRQLAAAIAENPEAPPAK